MCGAVLVLLVLDQHGPVPNPRLPDQADQLQGAAGGTLRVRPAGGPEQLHLQDKVILKPGPGPGPGSQGTQSY